MPPIPHPGCPTRLASLIEIKYALLHEIGQQPKFRSLDLSSVLSLAVSLHDANVEELHDENKELRSYILTNTSYARRDARATLNDILMADEHLHRCCQTAWGLAHTIDLLAPDALKEMPVSWDEGGIETALPQLINSLYASDFRRIVFVRLYNFDSDCLPFSIPLLNGEIIKLGLDDIAELLGEVSAHSALHDAATGTCFFKFEGNDPIHDNEAFNRAWQNAHQFLRVLKFFKYGTLDLDYGAIYYAPHWVTQLRRYGLRFWGQPRRDNQASFYSIAAQDIPKLHAYGSAYEKLKHIIEDPEPKSLRLANGLAGNYYEGHYRRAQTERDQKLIELVIALEALFSPGKEGELRFRIAQRAAVFLGKDSNDRHSLIRFFKNIYDARSQIVHSGISAVDPPKQLKDKSKDLKILDDSQLAQLGDFVRQAVLRSLILVWRGKSDRDEINAMLDRGALDEQIREELFELSDFERALEELLKSPT